MRPIAFFSGPTGLMAEYNFISRGPTGSQAIVSGSGGNVVGTMNTPIDVPVPE